MRGAQAADGETRIERKSCLRGGLRLIQRAEQRQSSGEPEMRNGMISVGLDAPAQPSDCFGVCVKLQLGKPTNIIHR